MGRDDVITREARTERGVERRASAGLGPGRRASRAVDARHNVVVASRRRDGRAVAHVGHPANRAGAFFQCVGRAVSGREQCADAPAEEGIGDQGGDARIHAARQRLVTGLDRRGEDKAGMVERTGGLQLDGRAERAFFQRGRVRLVNCQGGEQIGGKDVEVETAAAIGAASARARVGGRHVLRTDRGDRFDTVDQNARELRAETTDGDFAAFAGFTVEGDARDALQRFRNVHVREFADVLSQDGVGRVERIALDVQCLLKAGPVTGHDDRFHVLGVGGAVRTRNGQECHRRCAKFEARGQVFVQFQH